MNFYTHEMQTDITTIADSIKSRCIEIYENLGFDLRSHKCPHPQHSGDNSGAFSIYRTTKGETRCTCHSHHCFAGGTALDIIAANYSLSLPRDYAAAVEIGAQILGLPFSHSSHSRSKYRATPRRQQQPPQPQPQQTPPQPQPLSVEQWKPMQDTTPQSEFFAYLVALFGDEARVYTTLQRYGVCSYFTRRRGSQHYVHKTRFLFGSNGSVWSFKDIEYKTDGHRNKEAQIYQFAPNGVRCLFGEHLISTAVKTLSIHEAEKTAIVEALHSTATDVLPLAVGGYSQINTLTASPAVQTWLASTNENNIVLFLDGDKSGADGDAWRRVAQQINERHSRTCCYLLEYSQYCRIYHGDPTAAKGDLADVIEFARKNSRITTKAAEVEQDNAAKKITSKNAVFVENTKSGLSVASVNEASATKIAPPIVYQIAPPTPPTPPTAATAAEPYKYNTRMFNTYESYQHLHAALTAFAAYHDEAFFSDVAQALKRKYNFSETATREACLCWLRLGWTSHTYRRPNNSKGIEYIRLTNFSDAKAAAQINAESQLIQPF